MQHISLTTTWVMNVQGLSVDPKRINSIDLRDRQAAKGLRSDPIQSSLYLPLIAIIDPFGKSPQVKFFYPKKQGRVALNAEASEFKVLDTDPLRMSFKVTDGKNIGFYTIIEAPQTGEWSGYFSFSEKAEPAFSLVGQYYEYDM